MVAQPTSLKESGKPNRRTKQTKNEIEARNYSFTEDQDSLILHYVWSKGLHGYGKGPGGNYRPLFSELLKELGISDADTAIVKKLKVRVITTREPYSSLKHYTQSRLRETFRRLFLGTNPGQLPDPLSRPGPPSFSTRRIHTPQGEGYIHPTGCGPPC